MSSESQNNGSNTMNTANLNEENLADSWGWFFALGVGMIVVGALAVVFSGLATFSITLILGWAMIVGGIFHGVHAFFVRNWGGFFMQGLAAFLYIVVGGLVLANPIGAVFMLTLLLAVFFLFEGLVKVFLSFQVKPTQNWGWILFSGILSLILSAIIWLNWPGDAVWVVGLLFGVNLLFSGWATIMFSMGMRGMTYNWGGSNNRNVTPTT